MVNSIPVLAVTTILTFKMKKLSFKEVKLLGS